MTRIAHWGIDPFDIVWKNFFDANSTFNTFENKINYPVDILETENGLRFELAVVGLSETDLDIQVDGETLRISYNKPETEEIKPETEENEPETEENEPETEETDHKQQNAI